MANDVYDLKWGQEAAGKITNQVKEAVKADRNVRPLIPIVGGEMTYAKTVPDTTVVVLPGGGISINPARTLAPIKLSSPFVVPRELFDDLATISQLAISAGGDLAAAEDAVLLFGANAGGAVGGFPANDESGTLPNQVGLLAAFPAVPIGAAVDACILAAIAALRVNRHLGPFCVVLSPDLHQAAFTPIPGTATPVIAPVLPQLRQDGVKFSPSLPAATGVVFSVGKAAIDLVIPWDLHVECREVRGNAQFVVIEQFRLRINNLNAAVAL